MGEVLQVRAVTHCLNVPKRAAQDGLTYAVHNYSSR